MFSVDNFYEVFKSHYAFPEKNNILWTFNPHGAKDWECILPYSNEPPDTPSPDRWIFNKGAILMHDQEPFFKSQVQHFLNCLGNKTTLEECKTRNPLRSIEFDRHHKLYNNFTLPQFIHQTIRNSQVPIICHSEKNSQDIEFLETIHWVSCYYWWHGMVARDWFRHWEQRKDLRVFNKSAADYRFLIYSRDASGSRIYRKKVIDYLKKYQSQINYNWNGDYRCATLSATIDVNDANNSAIHLVAETLFKTEKIYLTEKVFKPMVMCQPFILFAPPGSLQYLRDYGFKTFNHVWPEDYDLIMDPNKRKRAILTLIDSLASISASQFNELYQELLPVIEHNRTYFYSAQFQDLLWKELQKNSTEALIRQQELSKQFPGGVWLYYVNEFVVNNNFLPLRWNNFIKGTVANGNITIEQLKVLYPKLFEYY